jgi:transposase
MSEAKKYDRSYKEQSVKPALEIGVKQAGEELKVPYGTLYGWL